MLVDDDHDLIHKAVGGWVRQAGKRDPDGLLDFLDRFAATMPRAASRYSVEHLDKSQRDHYMGEETGLDKPACVHAGPRNGTSLAGGLLTGSEVAWERGHGLYGKNEIPFISMVAVEARPAVDPVPGCSIETGEARVVAWSSSDHIDAEPAEDRIAARLSSEHVIIGPPVHVIVASATPKSVAVLSSREIVPTNSAVEEIRTPTARDPIVSGTSVKAIGVVVAREDVRATPSKDDVLPLETLDEVTTAEAADDVSMRSSDQPVRLAGPRDRARMSWPRKGDPYESWQDRERRRDDWG